MAIYQEFDINENAGRDAELLFDATASCFFFQLTPTGLFGATVELPQCEMCNEHFNPAEDDDNGRGEYRESIELGFHQCSENFPDRAQRSQTPLTYCSQQCEDDAADEWRIGMCEFRQAVRNGEYDLDDSYSAYGA